MFSRHDSIQELPGAPKHASFPTAHSRVACLPEYFMYCNYLKRLGTRQLKTYNGKDTAGESNSSWEHNLEIKIPAEQLSIFVVNICLSMADNAFKFREKL
jgi:hypothetical protein